MDKYLSQREVVEKTGLKFYQLEHIKKISTIKVYHFDKNNHRNLPRKVIEIILALLKILQIIK